MPRFYRKLTKKAGVSPGTLVAPTVKKIEHVKLTLFDYDKSIFQEKELKNIEQAFPFKEKPTVTWLNVCGLHQIDILQKIGTHFDIHPLVLEDILATSHQPKIEHYDSYIYLVIKNLDATQHDSFIDSEQISIILGPNFVITFREKDSDLFDVIKERIRNNESRLRNKDTDYLAYRLIDTIVDNYYSVLEKVGQDTEVLEESIMEDVSTNSIEEIHRIKRELIFLRKSIWPMREVLNIMIREQTPLIQDTTDTYLRDVYDHIIQVVDSIENLRELVSGMMDLYLNLTSNKMNEVMKVLTIIATIFIPLTFIAGIYGMNFENMPELKLPLGYFYVWTVMILIFVAMMFYFKKKKWF